MASWGTLVEVYERSPQARMVLRSGAAAAAGYLLDAVRNGTVFSMSALGAAAATGALYAVIGLTTPVEPYVGVNKANHVEVPVPPATPER